MRFCCFSCSCCFCHFDYSSRFDHEQNLFVVYFFNVQSLFYNFNLTHALSFVLLLLLWCFLIPISLFSFRFWLHFFIFVALYNKYNNNTAVLFCLFPDFITWFGRGCVIKFAVESLTSHHIRLEKLKLVRTFSPTDLLKYTLRLGWVSVAVCLQTHLRISSLSNHGK